MYKQLSNIRNIWGIRRRITFVPFKPQAPRCTQLKGSARAHTHTHTPTHTHNNKLSDETIIIIKEPITTHPIDHKLTQKI